MDEGLTGPATYMVSLGSDPDESNGHGVVSEYDVVVSVTLSETTDASVSVGSLLTFTSANWDQTQPVSVVAVSDAVSEADVESFVVSHSTTSVLATGTKYGGGVEWSPRSVYVVDDDVAKVSVVGVGMRSHSGVAQKMFSALAADGVNIKVITTSEIKVSVLIDRKYMELAVQSLHGAFGLDAVA